MQKTTQLTLFCVEDKLVIEPVLGKFALEEERFQIGVTNGEKKYTFAGQWTSKEVVILQNQIKGFNWRLNEEGYPEDLEDVYASMEEIYESLYPDANFISIQNKIRWHNKKPIGNYLKQ